MYETVIGLEIHAQLLTKTKLFCGCGTSFGSPPNSLTCPVCMGLPGALPVLNREAVRMALKLALAIKADINVRSIFSRKNYFYPDLPKGYQITQYHAPIARGGAIEIETGGQTKTVGIERINLEEDAGKSIHDGMSDSDQKTYLDFNRSGVPLLEIVGKPELSSPAEAVEFLQLFRAILQHLEICDGNMEEGNLRCDANLSVRKQGDSGMGVKTEVKNLNSFRFLHKALEYEAHRQMGLLDQGLRVRQETRLWDAAQNKTLPMRSKEEAHDYRYFPEPDLPPLVIGKEMAERARADLPELPQAKVDRFIKEYQIPRYDAKVLTATKALAGYFEETAQDSRNPKQASNWVRREVLGVLKESNSEISRFPIPPQNLAELIRLIEKKEITLTVAKESVFPEMLRSGKSAPQIIRELGLAGIQDEEKVRQTIAAIIQRNPGPVRQYQEGKFPVLGFLVGLAMKEMGGAADARLVQKILKEILDSLERKA